MKTPTTSLVRLRPTLAALLGILLASFALGQPATGCITGFVTIGSDNAYLAAADVSVNATNRTTNTDRRGEFD